MSDLTVLIFLNCLKPFQSLSFIYQLYVRFKLTIGLVYVWRSLPACSARQLGALYTLRNNG